MLWAVTFLIAMLTAYALARPWLRDRPWLKWFFDWIEPIEISLWKKSETLLFARTKMLAGILFTALTQLGEVDITPLMPFIPDEYERVVRFAWNLIPLSLTILGWIDQQQRYDTTKPVEIVALPEEKTVAEAEAVKKVEAANAEAKEIVAAEKANRTGTGSGG